MDASNWESDGVTLQVRFCEDGRASVIILTTYDSDEDVYRGMRAGAKAYLLKDAYREELLNCIRAAYAGKTVISLGVASKLVSRLCEDEITPRELEIFNLVAQGLSNKLIARALEISEGTVKTHVKNVLEKLDATSRTEALAVAADVG